MKTWRVTAELYWSANHEESIEVKANTARKAEKFARERFLTKYPNLDQMLIIRKVERID